MKLPRLDPQKDYQGLYVVDFGPSTGSGSPTGDDTVGVGYTAEEVAILLEQEKYAAVKVFKLHKLRPDGTMELQGVTAKRFASESAFVFCSREAERAQKDFDDLAALAEKDPPPCKARLLVGRLGYAPQFPEVAALLYPAEYEDEMSAWLLKHDFQGGETCDAGMSHAATVNQHLETRRSAQLAGVAWRQSRSREEILRAVGDGVQR
jgi:hypothetical protein